MEEILKILEDLKAKKYIKDGWLDNIKDEIFTEKHKYRIKKDKKFIKEESNILECINNCTSPTGEKPDEKLKAIFRAFSLFPMEKTKNLILGQDPYPDNDADRVEKYGKRAHGLAFSFANSKGKIEPADDSLLNIFKAIEANKENCKFDEIDNINIIGDETKNITPWDTNLKIWAEKNGVLLLNTALTYEENQKTKHQTVWKPFIKNIITNLLTCNNGKLVVFLWGADARKLFHEIIYYERRGKVITDLTESIKKDLLVLTTSHPSNQGVRKGFSEKAPNHFKACDEFLFGKDETKYVWKNFPENNK